MKQIINLAILFNLLISYAVTMQAQSKTQWSSDGKGIFSLSKNALVKTNVLTGDVDTIIGALALNKADLFKKMDNYSWNEKTRQLLVFANTARVWRYNTKGDYWVFDDLSKKWHQLGKSRPAQTLMFTKLSPDGKKAAYVSEQNIYLEDLKTGAIKALTTDGNRRMINGTFDWVYEEEFACRDGFRWSPDGKKIAFWQVNAAGTKDFMMMDNTAGIYSKPIPVEYPKVGEAPSAVRIGVIDLASGKKTWMDIPGDQRQHYIPRMEWAGKDEVIVQQLNRKQNESMLFLANAATGKAFSIHAEKDAAWIDILPSIDDDYSYGGWDWLDEGKSFLWVSEQDGWRHLYRMSRNGKESLLLTKGNFDVIEIAAVKEKEGYVYFYASPDNATQKYLFRTKLDGSAQPERITPKTQPGTHQYDISPVADIAYHSFSNHKVQYVTEAISLNTHLDNNGKSLVQEAVNKVSNLTSPLEFFKVKTDEGVEMDGWMVKPENFDPSKKYPVVFFVYSEPAGANVIDRFGVGRNRLYAGDMRKDGYVYVTIDNRGTPVPKGREWRKSIYRKIGIVNIDDQAKAAKEVFKMGFIDTSRVAVWGWSGGGSATLNLMFRYPEIYKTGISIAAVAFQLTYDNIYQERYMGLPQENREDFVKGSPITHAKNLRGNLLYIHGTGDDNVHYQNAELLQNELIKYNKQFQFMSYPNRSHSISEGEGTTKHLSTLYTNYLKQYCPPGGR
ncbi:MAG: S9 family peptidase [Chitinophagaceae bacterium]|nr:S9 family peptidase [Chitinophagaceae bacterium]